MSLDVPMIVFQLVWLDPNDIVISTNSVNMNQSGPDVSIQSIDLSLSLIDPATIGMYSCMANFSNYNVTARADYELIGQGMCSTCMYMYILIYIIYVCVCVCPVLMY